VQDSDNTADHSNELHIVLDNNEAGIDVDRAQQISGALHLIGGHPGRGLVEEYQFWPLRDDHTYLDPLPLAVGQHAHLATGDGL